MRLGRQADGVCATKNHAGSDGGARRHAFAVALLGAALSLAFLAVGAGANASATHPAHYQWAPAILTVRHPQPAAPSTLRWHETSGLTPNMLRAVFALSPSDAWAVGDKGTVLRWNGSTWSETNIGSQDTLYDIYMLSDTDGFITGWGAGGSGPIYRWNGSTWNLVYTAPVNVNKAYPLSANDVWVSGLGKIYHYNGTTWSASYTQPAGQDIFGIAMVSPTEGWAAGTGGYRYHYLNGTWTMQGPAPSPGSLFDLFALAANEVWASGISTSTYILRYDGVQWTRAITPTDPIDKIHFLSPTDGWGSGPFGQVDHYDGVQMTTVYSTSNHYGLNDIFMLSPTEGWAVGGYENPPNSDSIILHYYDDGLPEATPTPTGIPGVPTPTPCSVSFTDVLPDNTFYAYIRCLACRGFVSGYSDGTFKPDNNITRGQLSKIVSNAASFNDTIPSDQQSYTDVLPSDTFWLWIERLTLHGAMSGYDCGGAGEPCDAQQRPYFRPGNNATRGQIAKIVSNAANIQDAIPSTQQTFEDVPYTNTFWLWIERLASRGTMGGYACGGPGEPCDPQQRPYFRPGNNATRGQVPKIVANTFYPNCSTPAR